MEGLPKQQEDGSQEPKIENHDVLNFPDGARKEHIYVHPETGDKIHTYFGDDRKPLIEEHRNADGVLQYWLEFTKDAMDPVRHDVISEEDIKRYKAEFQAATKAWGENMPPEDEQSEAA